MMMEEVKRENVFESLTECICILKNKETEKSSEEYKRKIAEIEKIKDNIYSINRKQLVEVMERCNKILRKYFFIKVEK